MDRKASENLEAAALLLAHEDPCSNAAATRAYYAVYHALWARLAEGGEEVPEVRRGVRYFPHRPSETQESITDVAERRRVLTPEQISDVERLGDFRIKADYRPDDVVLQEARDCLDVARGIVERLTDGGGP